MNEEGRREMPEGVTEEIGCCIYCGQIHMFHNVSLSQEQLNEAATEQCDCREAREYSRLKKKRKALEDKIRAVFRQEEELGNVLIECLPLLIEDKLDSLKVKNCDGIEGAMKKNAQGFIRVERKAMIKNCIEE